MTELPDEIKRYYEQKLLEEVMREPVFKPTEDMKAKPMRERLRDWFLERFADLYEKVRGDYD